VNRGRLLLRVCNKSCMVSEVSIRFRYEGRNWRLTVGGMAVAESGKLKSVGGVVRGGESYEGKQGLDYTPGVSAETVGSQALWLGTVPLPPRGGRTKAHLHENHESALYMLSGENVEVYTGEQLEHRDVANAGDYLYFPAGVPHVAVNRGETPAVFVAARTDPNEQESVVMRPELDEKVP
jgi:uncharacterized RmlC-like cupin family protein